MADDLGADLDQSPALARRIGAALSEKGCATTDEHQQSSVDGFFAAGDVVRSLDQISVAMGRQRSPRRQSITACEKRKEPEKPD